MGNIKYFDFNTINIWEECFLFIIPFYRLDQEHCNELWITESFKWNSVSVIHQPLDCVVITSWNSRSKGNQLCYNYFDNWSVGRVIFTSKNAVHLLILHSQYFLLFVLTIGYTPQLSKPWTLCLLFTLWNLLASIMNLIVVVSTLYDWSGCHTLQNKACETWYETAFC